MQCVVFGLARRLDGRQNHDGRYVALSQTIASHTGSDSNPIEAREKRRHSLNSSRVMTFAQAGQVTLTSYVQISISAPQWGHTTSSGMLGSCLLGPGHS